MRFLLFAAVAALCLADAHAPATAQQPQPSSVTPTQAPAQPPLQPVAFEEEARRLLVRIEGRPVQLDTLIVKPRGVTGALPVALITHGKPPDRVSMGDMRPDRMRQQARDMARRGWLAVAIMRRGFGQSDGPPAPDMTCSQLTFVQRFERDAQDLAAVLAEVLKRPDAQPSAIAMGVSAGGAAVLALAAMQPPALKAVVNISGGLRVDSCLERSEATLVDAIKTLGPRIKVPALWIYADNDSFFGPNVVDRMYETAITSGMQVRRVALPAIGSDGHNIFNLTPGRRAWLAELDQSLRGWQLPTWRRDLIEQLARVIRIDPARNRTTLENYITSPGEKAMAFSPSSGRIFFRFGGGNQQVVEEGAVKDCNEAKLSDCRVVLRDNAPAHRDAVPAR